MEQRIQTLEEEVKLLKNQIRAVLLDIKENLASGDWQTHPGNSQAADPGEDPGQQPQEKNFVNPAINFRPVLETTSIPASRVDPAGYDRNEILSPQPTTPRPGQPSGRKRRHQPHLRGNIARQIRNSLIKGSLLKRPPAAGWNL